LFYKSILNMGKKPAEAKAKVADKKARRRRV
jgi:hypothetical protein